MDAAGASTGIGRVLQRGLAAVRRVGDNRHLIRFAAGEALHPIRFTTAFAAYRDGLRRQGELFVRQQVDDVTDAMRHAGVSARIVHRVTGRGAEPSVAADFMRRLGQAHELDSKLTGAHRAASEAMDLHNNELGISLALAHGRPASPASEQALEGAVLQALAAGRGLVLDSPTAAPRPSSVRDLLPLLRDPSVIAG